MPAAESPPAAVSRACQNCGTPMLGSHCYACGQPVKGLVRHFSSILGDFADSVFDLDSRLLRTLGPLLLRPGRLSLEYFAGHRVRYVSPVRLFVFLVIVLFFLLRWMVDPSTVQFGNDNALEEASSVAEVEHLRAETQKTLQARLAELGVEHDDARGIKAAIDATERRAERRIAWLQQRDAALASGGEVPVETRQGQLTLNGRPWHPRDNPIRLEALPEAANALLNRWAQRAEDNIHKVQKEPALLVEAFIQSLPQTFFVLLPLFALLLKLAYLLQRRLYMEHLIVALHGHAFLCAALLLVVGSDALGELFAEDSAGRSLFGWLGVLVVAWIPPYLWLLQKRVYAQGVILTTLKFLLLSLCFLLLVSLGAIANFLTNLVVL